MEKCIYLCDVIKYFINQSTNTMAQNFSDAMPTVKAIVANTLFSYLEYTLPDAKFSLHTILKALYHANPPIYKVNRPDGEIWGVKSENMNWEGFLFFMGLVRDGFDISYSDALKEYEIQKQLPAVERKVKEQSCVIYTMHNGCEYYRQLDGGYGCTFEKVLRVPLSNAARHAEALTMETNIIHYWKLEDESAPTLPAAAPIDNTKFGGR